MDTGHVTSRRLWDIEHPYYGAEAQGSRGDVDHFGTFAELRDAVDNCDEDMNFVYRWDWYDPKAAHNDDNYSAGDSREGKQKLTTFIILQRKSRFLNWSCDVTHTDEAAVLEWLHSDRVLGSLRRTWAPVLDLVVDVPMDLAYLRSDIDYWQQRAEAAEAMIARLSQRIVKGNL